MKGDAPLSGTEEQTARTTSAYAQRACFLLTPSAPVSIDLLCEWGV
jgi:hypothetical protein